MADPHQFAGATAPFGVRLNVIQHVGLQILLHLPAVVKMLAGRDGDRRGPFEACKTFYVRHGERLFDPRRVILFDAGGPSFCVVQVPAHEGVEHQIDVVPYALPQGANEFHVCVEPSIAV